MNVHHNPSKYSGKIIAGFILTAIGLGLLFQQLNWFFFPGWLFSWPMILIIFGLVKRANNPNNSSWLVLIVIGCLFLVEKIFPGENVIRLGWPVIIIAAGLWIIFRRNYDFGTKNTPPKEAFANDGFLNPEPAEPQPINQSQNSTGEDYLNSFSVFGDVKKNIFSKTFKGGEVVNIFAGTHLDFSHADISGRVVIDIIQLFGGTKLIVPPHWQVVSDIAPIFGGVSDKRTPNAELAASGKVLVLKGVSMFGGVDIKSF
ncbi:LiaF transmembrane domain-containing protein [Mucilaginibacter sp.]|uniref:LiaF transmembrane domain-containing protein n=1 Tax=Mucilaginibacter sp. TaxID=1882438 RepID=UPI003B00CAD1